MINRYFEITDKKAIDLIRTNIQIGNDNRKKAEAWGKKHGFDSAVILGHDFFDGFLAGFLANEHYHTNLQRSGVWTKRPDKNGAVRPVIRTALHKSYKQICSDVYIDSSDIHAALGFHHLDYFGHNFGIKTVCIDENTSNMRVFFITNSPKGIPNAKEISNLNLLEIERASKEREVPQ